MDRVFSCRAGLALERCSRAAYKSQLQSRLSSSFAHLQSELTSRKLPLLFDVITSAQSILLDNTLSDFLPPYHHDVNFQSPRRTSKMGKPRMLRPSYHLIHFPPASKISELLHDNTDPDQSPGQPFVRRMWAGGRIQFFPFRETAKLNSNTGRATCCFERISDVKIKGNEGDEKIFVTIERRISGSRLRETTNNLRRNSVSKAAFDATASLPDDTIREFLMNDDECGTIEQRNIVFMRERTPEQAKAASDTPSKILKAPHEPTFSHALTPPTALLFRFSALTWNAHRIHLDKEYCRNIEGHRNLLFHGPLSLVMMVELLQRHLSEKRAQSEGTKEASLRESISEIEYRNIAPLYAEEELRLCGREKGDGSYDLWVEGKEGGMCVKATAKVDSKMPIRPKHNHHHPLMEADKPIREED